MSRDEHSDPSGTVTRLLDRARVGDLAARDALFELVYDELRRRARARLRSLTRSDSGSGLACGLDGTSLAHEACAKLLARDTIDARNRGHFFAIFSRAMGDALVDALRKDASLRRGGDRRREHLVDVAADESLLRIDVLVVEEAMAALAAVDADAARMVELRIFGGLTLEEAAGVVGSTPAVARGHFDYGRAWLARRLAGPNHPGS